MTAYFIYYIFGNYYSYPYNKWYNKTVLPNLGASIDRAFFMAIHITCGILSMFIGSIQFIKQIRNAYGLKNNNVDHENNINVENKSVNNSNTIDTLNTLMGSCV